MPLHPAQRQRHAKQPLSGLIASSEATTTVHRSAQPKNKDAQDILAAIFAGEKMPESAKDLADMIMQTYTSSEDPYSTTSTLLDKVKAKLNAKMRIRRKRVNGMSPGQRVLGSAIARSCQPRHVDE